MGRFGLAISLFFKVLGNARFAESARELADSPTPRLEQKPSEPKPEPKPKTPPPPKRSDAVSLLAALQRDARLVDFLMEDLSGYSDAQIGAAARDVQVGSRQTLQRLLGIEPLRTESEGAAIEVLTGFDSGQIQLVGKVEGEPPFRGELTHHGWKASQVSLPSWSGSDQAATVIAAAEVELK